ncbi:hypothetical protein E2C01_031710 [Portunus trituberculatus]|uniref:Uncharacterized protein n=1 Tax=Portunus trituberculatus TaxID=210409 RepID=A0A5B7EYC5_PORTR|nr:hypothetical protein [Portunus trituberculatus]
MSIPHGGTVTTTGAVNEGVQPNRVTDVTLPPPRTPSINQPRWRHSITIITHRFVTLITVCTLSFITLTVITTP